MEFNCDKSSNERKLEMASVILTTAFLCLLQIGVMIAGWTMLEKERWLAILFLGIIGTVMGFFIIWLLSLSASSVDEDDETKLLKQKCTLTITIALTVILGSMGHIFLFIFARFLHLHF